MDRARLRERLDHIFNNGHQGLLSVQYNFSAPQIYVRTVATYVMTLGDPIKRAAVVADYLDGMYPNTAGILGRGNMSPADLYATPRVEEATLKDWFI